MNNSVRNFKDKLISGLTSPTIILWGNFIIIAFGELISTIFGTDGIGFITVHIPSGLE